MLNSSKNAFWEALVMAVFVFSFGILLGFLLENSRTSKISDMYEQSNLDLLDVRIQNDIFSLSDVDCGILALENTRFADRIYGEAKLLDKYEISNKVSDSIALQHKKYDLMRALLWVNSIKLREKCNSSVHDVVYLYDYNNPSLEAKAKQNVFSKMLGEVKSDVGGNVVLIPLSGDNGIFSVSLLMNLYGVSEQDLPVILIDEKVKITGVVGKDEILKYLQ